MRRRDCRPTTDVTGTGLYACLILRAGGSADRSTAVSVVPRPPRLVDSPCRGLREFPAVRGDGWWRYGGDCRPGRGGEAAGVGRGGGRGVWGWGRVGFFFFVWVN